MDKGALWKISPRERGKKMEGEGDKRICQELPSSFRICGDGDDKRRSPQNEIVILGHLERVFQCF